MAFSTESAEDRKKGGKETEDGSELVRMIPPRSVAVYIGVPG